MVLSERFLDGLGELHHHRRADAGVSSLLYDPNVWLSTEEVRALTFDDGPDPKWTPKVLDILKRETRERVPFS